MPEARKRPCAICRRWFRPDGRVGSRQHACGNPECQTSRRQKTQAGWRRRNPGYAIAWRIDRRVAQTPSPPEPLRMPAPLNQRPWDVAKDQFGPQGADFIGVMGALMVRSAKDQFRARQPHLQRRLLASLAESRQQTPIVVVLSPEQRDRYLVIDGHKRIAALQQLGRDTVEATVWTMSAAEALLLDRSEALM